MASKTNHQPPMLGLPPKLAKKLPSQNKQKNGGESSLKRVDALKKMGANFFNYHSFVRPKFAPTHVFSIGSHKFRTSENKHQMSIASKSQETCRCYQLVLINVDYIELLR